MYHFHAKNCQRIIFSSESGSGKSTFIKQIITHCHTGYTLTILIISSITYSIALPFRYFISVYVQTGEPTDFENVSRVLSLPVKFTIDEDNFSSIIL